jgi:hypothetical protein
MCYYNFQKEDQHTGTGSLFLLFPVSCCCNRKMTEADDDQIVQEIQRLENKYKVLKEKNRRLEEKNRLLGEENRVFHEIQVRVSWKLVDRC